MSGRDGKAGLGVAAPDDLQAKRAGTKAGLHPVLKLGTGIGRIGPDELEFGERLVDLIEHESGSVAILKAGGVNAHLQDQAIGVHQQMTFASHLLNIAAVGAFLPLFSRAVSRNASWSLSKSSCCRHFAK